jgi:large subunit ribosomal protein L6
MFTAKGPNGEMQVPIPEVIECIIDNNIITFTRPNDLKHVRALHGLSRALCNNAVQGVITGNTKTLQLEGVGYKVEMRGQNLLLSLGFSHPILMMPPKGITITAPTPNSVVVSGIDKQLVGEIAARIRRLRPPEPYKGKGIRYLGEQVRRKAGKTTAK